MVLLTIKARCIGGGVESGQLAEKCCGSKVKDESQGSLGAVSNDTAIMKLHILAAYESVLMIKYLEEGEDKENFV
jgi:hypothetical protein